ncbi:hypothetical protein [Cryobacterium fucosi]|uniref:Nucleotidyl transferase AbiEii/AbiGii toxin family protein n=1 Tax=Cryobacterium fucosi TaxID=1259157 RepID=A0A4R9BAH7_9MICO|nr:hypothetical protein [Cryobacterium fucosi]TFD79207.1 hypothetical protein E3T48_06455 [Cryobacterium fucosi]
MTTTQVAAETVSTSDADDAAFQALEDLAAIAGELDDILVVGGQMASLLLTAFPATGSLARRTGDADAAMTTAIAASGTVHDKLIAAGYEAVSGNHYERGAGGEVAVDLLVPATGSTFGRVEHGGRAFDAVPGLRLALSGHRILVDVRVTFRDGSTRQFTVPVPCVETAIILKAYATRSRLEAKDITDLYNLFLIVNQHDANTIGGWTLSEATLSGSRSDAARILHRLTEATRGSNEIRGAGVPGTTLVALIRRHVTDPR